MEKITDVVCSFCGCLCDDIEITIENGHVKDTKNTCNLGHARFSEYFKERSQEPMVRKNGDLKPVTLEEAIGEAANILSNSDYSLAYGWSSTTCEAQKKGVALTEKVSGVMDNTTSVCHGPSIIAEQGVGGSTCTLGQIKNRADLIIYWGCNPAHSHPRHLSRYTIYPRGFFRRKGERDRKIVVVDIRKTDTAKIADQFIQVKPDKDYELLDAIRTVLKGGDIPDEVAGVSSEEIEKLAEDFQNHDFGALFFGLGLTMSKGKYSNIDNVLSLVTDLNELGNKFTIMPMRGHFNVAGANKVFCWEARFPFAVDFARGYPRYGPGENSVVDVLRNEEADAAIFVASDPIPNLPRQTFGNLQEIPTITIDPHFSPTAQFSDVFIPSAISGIEAEGTAYRMDGVPIKLRKVKDPPEGILPDEEILEKIIERI